MNPWHLIATMTNDQLMLMADCLEAGIEGAKDNFHNPEISEDDITVMEGFVTSLRAEAKASAFTKLDIYQKLEALRQSRSADLGEYWPQFRKAHALRQADRHKVDPTPQ